MLKKCVGLDIGSELIKLVQLQKKGRGSYLVDLCQKIQTPKDSVTNGKIVDINQLRPSLERLIRAADLTTDNVVLGLGSPEIMIRKTEFPSMPGKELAQAIRFELSDILMLDDSSIEDIAFSYEVLHAGENQQKVLVVGCRRELVEPYIDLLNSVGLIPWVVDIAAFALPRLMNNRNGTCFVDLGANKTVIYVEKDMTYCVYRILPFGGSLITKAIQDTFEVDTLKAEDLKQRYDIDYLISKGIGEKSLLSSVFQQYVGGIYQTLDYLRSQARASRLNEVIDEVVLSGGNSLITGFDQLIREELGIDVTVLDPFRGIDFLLQTTPKDRPLYANAVGLALRGLEEI